MPIYLYRCTECSAQYEEFHSVDDRNNVDGCPQCESKEFERVMTPLSVISDIEPYRSTITGERISGRAHHRKHLAEHGYEEVGTDNFDEAKKMMHKPPADDKKQRIKDAKDAYEKLSHG